MVDFPKREPLYKTFPLAKRPSLYGHGFSLYGLLPDEDTDRHDTEHKLRRGFYDLVIIGNIWSNAGWLIQNKKLLDPSKTIVLDGADHPYAFPHIGHWLRRPYGIMLASITSGLTYFKREMTEETRFGLCPRLLPSTLRRLARQSSRLKQISFSIPEEKIIATPVQKEKDFPIHIVDKAVAESMPGAQIAYAFQNEDEYYRDLQISRFGITTKRAGWDCMRHYEIAANGTVPCFKDLHLKPPSCAPHGLNEDNCIVYSSPEDLLRKTRMLSDTHYGAMQDAALVWISNRTTKMLAKRIINED